MSEEIRYSEEHLEGAMCLWEEMIEARRENNLPEKFERLWIKQGAGGFRMWVALNLTPILCSCWDLAVERGFDDSFDWEFVPDFVQVFDEDLSGFEIVEKILERYSARWEILRPMGQD